MYLFVFKKKDMKKLIILSFIFVTSLGFVQAQWNITGNAGTNPPTQFLGTTDANNLVFKVNGQQAGKLEYDGTIANAAFGYQALITNTGFSNTATGYHALYSNTTGGNNDAFGYKALFSNTTTGNNSAFGNNALYNNTGGTYNCAFGCYSLFTNTTGSYNVAGGYSLYNNTSGSRNTALGFRALNGNTSAVENTAAGYQALYSNTLGNDNTGAGYQSLYSNTSGSSNTAAGYQALFTMNGASFNTAVGYQALYFTTNGANNTGVGYQLLYSNTTGNQNTGGGYQTLWSNTSGTNNTGFGSRTLSNTTSGSSNTAVGAYAYVQNGTGTNSTAIGYGAICIFSNQVCFGNNFVTSIGGYVGWSNISDGRFKKNIKENVPGLVFINQLRPITYTLDVKGLNQIASQAALNGAKTQSPEETEAIAQKEKIVYTGLVAQEVEAVAKKIGFDFSGVAAPKNEKDPYGLRYDDFVVPLVKSLQELNATHDSLLSTLDSLEAQINELGQQIELNNALKASLSRSGRDVAALGQNAPNPFSSNTVITYHIPANMRTASLTIASISGQILKKISITGKGYGQTVIAAGSLASGTYIYSLIVNGEKADTKQMILTR